MKDLIIYYSRRGQNHVNGTIKNLSKGNAELITEFIRDAVGADVFEVDTVKPYDADYMVCIEEAKAELRAKARRSDRVSPFTAAAPPSSRTQIENWAKACL